MGDVKVMLRKDGSAVTCCLDCSPIVFRRGVVEAVPPEIAPVVLASTGKDGQRLFDLIEDPNVPLPRAKVALPFLRRSRPITAVAPAEVPVPQDAMTDEGPTVDMGESPEDDTAPLADPLPVDEPDEGTPEKAKGKKSSKKSKRGK